MTEFKVKVKVQEEGSTEPMMVDCLVRVVEGGFKYGNGLMTWMNINNQGWIGFDTRYKDTSDPFLLAWDVVCKYFGENLLEIHWRWEE